MGCATHSTAVVGGTPGVTRAGFLAVAFGPGLMPNDDGGCRLIGGGNGTSGGVPSEPDRCLSTLELERLQPFLLSPPMSGDALPPPVKQLLARHIQSVEQLEVLLLLRSQPQRAWTATEVFDVIRSSQSSIAARLQVFTAQGFLVEEKAATTTYRFAPQDQNLQAAVDQTASAYQMWRVRVIEAIFAPEADPVQSFADAFKLRKD